MALTGMLMVAACSCLFAALVAGQSVPVADRVFRNLLVPSKTVKGMLTVVGFEEKVFYFPNDDQSRAISGRRKRQAFVNSANKLKTFLTYEFDDSILTRAIVRPEGLPLARIVEDQVFKAFTMSPDNFAPFLDRVFGPRLEEMQRYEKSWLPARSIISELRGCYYMNYGTTTNTTFSFNVQVNR